MKNIFTLLFFTGVITILCGCGREHKAPPTEKLALTTRFFRSIADNQPAQAVRQGRNLYALDKQQESILRLISIQESNEAVVNAQKLIRQGRINEALPIVAAAAKQYPHNRMLVSAYPKLVQLRNAEKLLLAMKNAKNASAMRGARIAARAGLSRNLTPDLRKYLQDYENLEKIVAKQEHDKIISANQQAQKELSDVKAADRKRAESEQLHQQRTAEKQAEGDQARSQAGAVPFEKTESTAK
jgi:hypothetical protein